MFIFRYCIERYFKIRKTLIAILIDFTKAYGIIKKDNKAID